MLTTELATTLWHLLTNLDMHPDMPETTKDPMHKKITTQDIHHQGVFIVNVVLHLSPNCLKATRALDTIIQLNTERDLVADLHFQEEAKRAVQDHQE